MMDLRGGEKSKQSKFVTYLLLLDVGIGVS